MARDLRDEDDWVGTPPEGRYGRERANPEFWQRNWPAVSVAGGLLAILVIVVLVLALL
jgi:hypothetical protein